jgi:hypothetical protein
MPSPTSLFPCLLDVVKWPTANLPSLHVYSCICHLSEHLFFSYPPEALDFVDRGHVLIVLISFFLNYEVCVRLIISTDKSAILIKLNVYQKLRLNAGLVYLAITSKAVSQQQKIMQFLCSYRTDTA